MRPRGFSNLSSSTIDIDTYPASLFDWFPPSIEEDSESNTSMATPVVEPFSETYADLRSASLEKLRAKTISKKYNNFRYVKPGQFSLPHYVTPPNQLYFTLVLWPASQDDCQIVHPSKRELWQEAQVMMRGCHHKSRCPDKKSSFMKREAERQERAARYEGQCWDKRGVFSHFTPAGDYVDYEEEAWRDAEYALNDAWWDAQYALNGLFGESQGPWEVVPEIVLDEYGGMAWELDRPVDFGALVDGARVDRRLRPGNGRGLRDWTEVGGDWLVSPDYEFVEDEDTISEFELV